LAAGAHHITRRSRRQKVSLQRKIELLHNSSERLIRALKLPRDKGWWDFIRRESWLHFKRSLELLWMVVRKKNGNTKPDDPGDSELYL
jgi:hypothetical protein